MPQLSKAQLNIASPGPPAAVWLLPGGPAGVTPFGCFALRPKPEGNHRDLSQEQLPEERARRREAGRHAPKAELRMINLLFTAPPVPPRDGPGSLALRCLRAAVSDALVLSRRAVRTLNNAY
ncbi:hypothetical protein SKAU_G00086700 [Synaphobranchus kaupii]|uniref:Uncharacterized protein n=1 Tax=Synaphobranchus kaupii TaxID=118154 RepID=A0A9Q1J4Z9_SYNKA|nr:hypothetical protein SKAU_G00086700 [Synaphobranchus kaupii]